MNRVLKLFLVVLVAAYFSLLFLTGSNFYSFATAPEEIVLDDPEKLALIENPSEIELTGKGFGPDTRVYMHMDVNNQSAVIGSLPFDDTIFDIEKYGDTLFLAGNNTGLKLLDVSDPLNPRFVQREYFKRASILDIERHGTTLYLSSGEQGVKIFEISEDETLVRRNQLPTWSAAVDAKVYKSFLYVAASKAGLLCYNRNSLDEKKPFKIIKPAGSGRGVRGVEVYQDYLYLAAGREGGLIYKISESGIPIFVKHIDNGSFIRSVKIEKDNLYILSSGNVEQYSLKDPSSPVLVAKQSHFSTPQKLLFYKNRTYVSDNESGLGIIDSIKDIGTDSVNYLGVGGDPRSVISVGKWLYAAVSRVGIKIIDTDAIVAKSVVRSINTPGVVRDFARHSDFTYLLDSKAGLTIQNDSSGQKMRIELLGNASRLHVSRGKLVITGRNRGLEIYDIADPDSPELIEYWPDIDYTDVAVLDDYLLTGSHERGLILFKRTQGVYQNVDQLAELSVAKILRKKDLIVVAGANQGVTFLKIQQGRLRILSSITPPFPANVFSSALGLTIQNNTLFVANGDGGVSIVDIQDIEKPKTVSYILLPGFSKDIVAEGNYVYVGSRYSGLSTIDISQLSRPRLVDEIPLYDVFGGLLKVANELYVGNRYQGVSVLPLPKEIKTVDVLSDRKMRIKLPKGSTPGRYSFYVSNQNSGSGYAGSIVLSD